MWAILALTFIVNVWGIKLLPLIELLGGIFHIAFFVALLVTLVVLAPRSSAEFVFTQFLNESGWPNDGVSWCVGLLTVTFCFVGEYIATTFHSTQPTGLRLRASPSTDVAQDSRAPST